MKSLSLISALFLLVSTNNTWADTQIPSGTCGENCNWKIEDGTLKITGGANGEIGTMDEFPNIGYDSPWQNYRTQINKVDVQGVSNISSRAFIGFSNASEANIGNTVTKIQPYAFTGTNIESIVIPDSVTEIGYRAFSDNNQNPVALKEIVISDSVNAVGNSAFGANVEQLQGLKIICKGNQDKCASVMDGYLYYVNELGYGLPLSLAGNVSPATSANCESANFFWSGTECLRESDKSKRKCSDGFSSASGYCRRVRYTPAEAAQVAGERNTVIMYFK